MIGRGALALLLCLGIAEAAPRTSAPPPMIAHLAAPNGAPVNQAQARGLADQAWAMMGREDRVSPPDQPPIRCTLAESDPLDIIAKAAADAQIVIVNEAHDQPRHRAFIEDVAERLAPLGYRTYAGETLMAPLSTTGAPRLSDGFYAGEPAFGSLLRTLRRLDFRLVPYEDEAAGAASSNDYVDDVNKREAAQASNLINRVFLADRNAKVLVHVGYAHNREDAEVVARTFQRPRQILFLARRLKDILGIDPLTIDQTTYAAERDGICFTDEYGRAPPTGRDLYVTHPAPAFERGRPTWRIARGERLADAPAKLRRSDERVVLEARRAADPPDAVPADRILIDPGEDLPLLLEPGAYKVRAWTDADSWSQDVPLTVRAPAPPTPPRRAAHSPRRKKR